MSVNYKLVGKRWLRKYTASKPTPVYAAESEVSKLSSSLCDVPWRRAAPKSASMTYHTNEIVYWADPVEKKGGITGLDYNVLIRDEFDAALFCGGHVSETHVVYGNAACYKFVLPDMASYPLLESLKVNVTSDPYNAAGARIAVLTNSTGVIPMACDVCRQGSAPSGSHSCTHSGNAWTTNDTYADAVAPREERSVTSGGKTTTNWYPVNATCTFDLATPLQLQKYVYVFVVLENYNMARGNWVEGCSFIENLVDITTSGEIAGWTSGAKVDCSSEEGVDAAGVSSVDIVKDGVVADVAGATSPVVSCTVLSSGTKVRRTGEVADELPQVTDELASANSAAGVAGVYGRFMNGELESAPLSTGCPRFRAFGAGFCVDHGDRGVFRDASGATAAPMAVSLTAASLVVPFGVPHGFEAYRAQFDWEEWLKSNAPAPGAKFTFWAKPGAFVDELPQETLRKHAIYDASDATVDGWKLLGTCNASEGSLVVDVPEMCSAPFTGMATVLVTAYMPQGGVPRGSEGFSVGTSAGIWYDSVTPDDLLSLMADYPVYSEYATYAAGDLVQFGTNEAERWALCAGTDGVAFTSVATDGSTWVAASAVGAWHSLGGARFARTPVTAEVDGVAYAGGYFVAWHGTKLYVATSGPSAAWTTVTLPAAITAVEARSGAETPLVFTAGGVYSVSLSAGTYEQVASTGSANEAVRTSAGTAAAYPRGMYCMQSGVWSKAQVEGSLHRVTALAAHPSAVLAFTDAGMFLGSAAGTTWAYSGLRDVGTDTASDGTTVLVAAGADLMRVDNGTISSVPAPSAEGRTWTGVYRVAGAWFARTSDGVLYRSSDLDLWTSVYEGVDVALSGVVDMAGKLAVGLTDGFAFSRDGGRTWVHVTTTTATASEESPVTPGMPGAGRIRGVDFMETEFGTLAFAVCDNGIFDIWPNSSQVPFVRSLGVVTWLDSEFAASTPWYCVSRLPAVADADRYVFAGGEGGLFRYDTNYAPWDHAGNNDHGTWVQQRASLDMGPVYDLLSFTANSVDYNFALAQNGLFRFYEADMSRTFQERTSDPSAILFARNAMVGLDVEPWFRVPFGAVDVALYAGGDPVEVMYSGYWGISGYPNVSPRQTVYRVIFHREGGRWAPVDQTYVRFDALYQYVALYVSGGTMTYYIPDGTDKTFTLSWSKTGSGDTADDWTPTIVGGDFDGTVLTKSSTASGSATAYSAFVTYTPTGGRSLKGTIYILAGDLSVRETTSRAILAAYMYNPVVVIPSSLMTDGACEAYDVRGQKLAMTFTGSESTGYTLGIADAASGWIEVVGAYGTAIPDFESVKWTGSRLVGFVEGDRAVYSSSDFGVTWTKDEELCEYSAFEHVESHGSACVASTKADGLFRSADAGATWTPVFASPAAFRGVAFVHDRWFAWTDGAAYSSADGATWAAVEGLSAVRCVSWMHGRFAAGTDAGSLWSNDGATWTASADLDGLVSSLSPADGKWFAATGSGLWYSGDKVLLDRLATTGQIVPGMACVEYVGGKWVGGSCDGGGLLYSTDGSTWKPSNVTSGTFVVIAATSAGWIAGGTAGLFQSTDGATWTKKVDGTFTRVVYDADTNMTFAAGLGVLYRSTNGGTTWTTAFPEFTKICGDNNGRFVAISEGGLFRSTNGTDWIPVASLFGTAFTSLRYEATSGKWLATTATALCVSSDSSSWTELALPAGVTLSGVTAYGSTYLGYSGSTVYRYASGSWTSGSPGVGTLVGVVHDGSGTVVAAGASGVKTSSDLATWTEVDVEGAPVKVVSTSYGSSYYARGWVVLTNTGKVYAKGDTASGVSDVTPAGDEGVYDTFAVAYSSSVEVYLVSDKTAYSAVPFGDSFSWTKSAGLPDGNTGDIADIAYAHGIVYAFVDGAAFILSTATWKWSRAYVRPGLYGAAAVSSSYTLLFGSGGSVYRRASSDGSLERVFSGGGTSFRAVAADGSGNCLAGGDAVLYKSTDSGETWTYASPGFFVADLAWFNSMWLAASSTGVMYSADASSWTRATGTTAYQQFTRLCVGDGSVVGCLAGGIARTTTGSSWTVSSFSGVTTLGARFNSEVQFAQVEGIADTFVNIEWDSTNSQFVATSARGKYVSATGETWTVQPWNRLTVMQSVNSSLRPKWMTTYNDKFYYRTTYNGTTTELTGVTGTPLGMQAPTVSYAASVAAWVLRTTDGYWRAYYNNNQYTPSVQKLSGVNTVVESSVYGGSVKLTDSGAYYLVTDGSVWIPVSKIYLPDTAAEAKIENSKVYWRMVGASSWTQILDSDYTLPSLGADDTAEAAIYGAHVRVRIRHSGVVDNALTRFIQPAGLDLAMKVTVSSFAGIVANGYYSEPVLFTPDGILKMFTSSDVTDGDSHTIPGGVHGQWVYYANNTTKMVAWNMSGSFVMVRVNGTSLEGSGNGGSSWTSLSSYTGTEAIRSLGVLNSQCTVVTDSGVYSSADLTTWTYSAFPSTLPEYVQNDSGVMLKVIDDGLWLSAAQGWVAFGYSQQQSDMFRTHPALLTSAGGTWTLHSEVSALYEPSASCPLLCAADDGDGLWIVGGSIGIAAGGLDSDSVWTRVYNSALASVTAVRDGGSRMVACLRDGGAVVSANGGLSWNKSILAAGTAYAAAGEDDTWVVVGDFGVRRSVGFLTTTLVSASTLYGFTQVDGDDALSDSTFYDVARHGGAWLAAGDAGIYRSEGATPSSWTPVCPGPCYRLLRSDVCWVALSSGGVYRSTDGVNWTRVEIALASFDIGVEMDGVFVIASSAMATESSAQDLFYSADGLTWTRAAITLYSSVGTSLGQFTSLAGHGGVLMASREKYASSGVGGLWMSRDRGATWSAVPGTLGMSLTRVVWSGRDRCWYAGGTSGMFYSTDGVAWTVVLDGTGWGTFAVNCIDDTGHGTYIGFEPNANVVPASCNLMATVPLSYPSRRLYRSKARIRTPGLFDPSLWEEVESPARVRMHGASGLCVPDITLYS